MKALYFSGKAGSGKTATALGIGIKLREKGLKVSYFKPLGFRQGTVKKDDSDVHLMREVFGLPFSGDLISPVTVSANYLSTGFLKKEADHHKAIAGAFKEVSSGYDIVLVDGSIDPFVGFSRRLDDFYLAKQFEAAVLAVFKTEDDFQLDRDLFALELWKRNQTSICGALFNNVSQALWNKTGSVYRPLVEEQGYSVLGVIPRRLEVSSPTVAEFYNALQGEILAAPERLDRIVEDVIVGTMTIESALSYLRRAPNKVLITGGDRSDLALTALETSTSAIIFTGGLYPDVRVLAQAESRGVPVILVHGDTFSTVENLHTVYRSIDPQNKEAIRIVTENIEKYVDWKKIDSFLEI